MTLPLLPAVRFLPFPVRRQPVQSFCILQGGLLRAHLAWDESHRGEEPETAGAAALEVNPPPGQSALRPFPNPRAGQVMILMEKN